MVADLRVLAAQGIYFVRSDESRADVSVTVGRTYKQMASQLRAAARSNMASVSKARYQGGYVNEFSVKEAFALDRMAEWCEARGQGKLTEDDKHELQRIYDGSPA